ncbi:hypothetical protein EDC01DRAFT_775431 [Geopyxis carbonaria]|nr:hypothetical protein EDC01DRAFT_775431 [Geopyxis carbonaria]
MSVATLPTASTHTAMSVAPTPYLPYLFPPKAHQIRAEAREARALARAIKTQSKTAMFPPLPRRVVQLRLGYPGPEVARKVPWKFRVLMRRPLRVCWESEVVEYEDTERERDGGERKEGKEGGERGERGEMKEGGEWEWEEWEKWAGIEG